MTKRWPSKLAGFAIMLLLPTGAAMAANGPQCVLPGLTPTPTKPYGASEREPRRTLRSTVFTLAVSWAPQYCATGEGMGGTFDSTFDCDTKANRFGFVLHGLWPDGDGKTWPQYCKPAKLLRPATIRANLCLTPSADLLQHEWAKHGTCAWRTPERYFADARAAFEKLRLPDMAPMIGREGLTNSDFIDAFVAVNPAIPRDAIRIAANRDGWFQEVRICLNARRRYMACPERADQPNRSLRVRPIG